VPVPCGSGSWASVVSMIVWTREGCLRSRKRTRSSSGECWCAAPPVVLAQRQPGSSSQPYRVSAFDPVQPRSGGYATIRFQHVG
jgi:hypothetical protein